jgi:hypothetical protein
VTIAPAAPAAPRGAFEKFATVNEPVDVLSTRLATVFPRWIRVGRRRA